MISQKSHYALLALFELGKRIGQGPVKIAQIAQSQNIPPRFLEVILHQLKRVGLVDSRRGMDGGYHLQVPPEKLTVGDVIESIQGPVSLFDNRSAKAHRSDGASPYSAVFGALWQEVETAITAIYDKTTFKDLLEREQELRDDYVASYTI